MPYLEEKEKSMPCMEFANGAFIKKARAVKFGTGLCSD